MRILTVIDTDSAPTGLGPRIEMVERKGLGHPDTIADAIAERFSDLYSTFSLAEFGEVAHHWVDKTMTIGGEAKMSFGASRMVRPIRVLVVGKATRVVGGTTIPVHDLAQRAVDDVFGLATPLLDTHRDVTVEVDLNDAVGSGRSVAWYRPASTEGLGGDHRARSNDTVMCNGAAPLTRLESLVLLIELVLNSAELRSHWPAIGSDIKVLARRVDTNVDIVACVPNLARLVGSRAEYDRCITAITDLVRNLCVTATPEFTATVALNTRDSEDVYLTHSGTALDTGDVGVVGRGNKLNGIIPLCKESGIEAPCGKNPTYHGGRIYSIVAQCIADRVWSRLGIRSSVNIMAANGDPIHQPSFLAVKTSGEANHATDAIDTIAADVLAALDRPPRDLPEILRRMVTAPVDRLTVVGWLPAGLRADEL